MTNVALAIVIFLSAIRNMHLLHTCQENKKQVSIVHMQKWKQKWGKYQHRKESEIRILDPKRIDYTYRGDDFMTNINRFRS